MIVKAEGRRDGKAAKGGGVGLCGVLACHLIDHGGVI